MEGQPAAAGKKDARPLPVQQGEAVKDKKVIRGMDKDFGI